MDKPNQLFKAFADETRLRLLNLLAQRPHCVCEFQEVLGVPQPTVSRHLAYLRRCGLVEEKRHGKLIMYSLATPRDAVHDALVQCVRGCLRELELLKQDLDRDRHSEPVWANVG